MNIVLIGPQGSGKGTQARYLVDAYGFFYFESGAYLRRIAENDPNLKKWLSEGKLVPDREMTSYLSAFFDSKNLYDGIIFDGFPRTLAQYNFWKSWLTDKKVSLDLVVDLTISEKETLRRLEARRMDPVTGKIYNLITDLPPENVDKGSLIQREDDKPEAIKKRLKLYKERTEPLITQLKKETKVVEINGEQEIPVIAKEINEIVSKLI
jgi:adenylate kinase